MKHNTTHAESNVIDVDGILYEITVPDIDINALGVLPSARSTQSKDIFAEEKRKAWDKSVEARCDFTYRLRLTRRSNVNFILLVSDKKSSPFRNVSFVGQPTCWTYR